MILIIITILGTTALTKGAMECDLTGPVAFHQCFGAVGKPLIFNLPTNTTLQMTLLKNKTSILTLNDNKREVTDYRNISTLLKNGTFKINCVTRDDAGDYELEIFSTVSGEHKQRVNVHLKIIEPVSDPNVSQTCLSPEQMNISCSAEGNGVKFTLSLDDNVLMQTRAGSTGKLNVSNVSFILHGQLVGKLVCRVQNDVSSEQTFIQLTGCKGAGSLLSLVNVAVKASLVCVLSLLAVFLGIKHFKRRTKKPTTVKGDEAEDEPVYRHLRVTPAARQLHD
ncbi:uncharacterized protein LOC133459310 isoform X1 [Cololabis saira]|uniref:uncharacterized protein LOC133459310 isoform X1 n=2 Tax=Cololabis saira TaxID=129043 RepID=UPI002AD4FA74|nr:uncharacterized protein LOC133459310 isoform X1 [Cololabis saira]